MRSAKSLTRCSALGGKASDRDEPATAAPHTRLSTTIGAPTAERKPNARMRAAAAPAAWSWLSIRAAPPERSTIAATLSPSSEKRSPTVIFSNPGSSAAASKRAVSSGSYRSKAAFCTSRQLANSATTAENTSDGGTPRATNVATRRSAACCLAARSASCRRRSASMALARASPARLLANSATTKKTATTTQFCSWVTLKPSGQLRQ